MSGTNTLMVPWLPAGMGPTNALAPPRLVADPALADATVFNVEAAQKALEAQRQKAITDGVVDPQTGWPTAKGVRETQMQLALGLGVRDLGGVRLNRSAPGFSDRISTRQPSLVKDPHNPDYDIGLPAFQEAVTNAKNYGARVDEVLPRHIGVTNASAEGFISHIADNLRALYAAVPERWRAGAANWYRGANQIAGGMADEFGTSQRAQAANLAALSPQRQWDHNVEGSRRTAAAVAGNDPWNSAMRDAWDEQFAVTNPAWETRYREIAGKRLDEITDPESAALWVRLHDRVNNDPNAVRIVNPDGTRGGLITTKAGQPAALAWGNLGAIGNSISVLRDDSLPVISSSMGGAHKVRNFYNNIISPEAGHDVTIDTHAISAGLLRPLGTSHPEVSYGLGSPVNKEYRTGPDIWPTTMAAGTQGVLGVYPLYAEAYRRVANELAILPRELQSVTWEGIRGLYSDVDRRSTPLLAENSRLWRSADGANANDIRNQLLGRGIRNPGWFGE